MKKIIYLALVLSAVLANAKGKQSRKDIEKCADRIQNECQISNNDRKRIVENGVACKQIQGFGNTLEAVVLESGDVTVVETKDHCNKTKFHLGNNVDIVDMKVISGRAFLATNSGAVYYIRSGTTPSDNLVFNEILKADRTSYKGVASIHGGKTPETQDSIFFSDANDSDLSVIDGQKGVGPEEIEALVNKRRIITLRATEARNNGASMFRN